MLLLLSVEMDRKIIVVLVVVVVVVVAQIALSIMIMDIILLLRKQHQATISEKIVKTRVKNLQNLMRMLAFDVKLRVTSLVHIVHQNS